jgi:hypothetical protein
MHESDANPLTVGRRGHTIRLSIGHSLTTKGDLCGISSLKAQESGLRYHLVSCQKQSHLSQVRACILSLSIAMPNILMQKPIGNQLTSVQTCPTMGLY